MASPKPVWQSIPGQPAVAITASWGDPHLGLSLLRVLCLGTGVEDRQSTPAAQQGRLLGYAASPLQLPRALDTPRVGVTSCHPGLPLAILTVGCQGQSCCIGRILSTTCSLRCSQWARPLAPSHGGAVSFLSSFQAAAVSPRLFPLHREATPKPDSKTPARSNGSSWLRFAGGKCLASGVRLPWEWKCLGKIRSGDVLIPSPEG